MIAPFVTTTFDDFGLSLHFGRAQGLAANSKAPMSRRTMQSRLPSSARGRPSASVAPASGAIGFPASIKGELGRRWKFIALTNWGLAEVWKRWQEFPVVVGPREKVIAQPPAALTPPAPMMLESIERGPSVTTWPGPVFAAIVSLVSLRPIEAPEAWIPCRPARTIKSLSSVTG